MYLVPVSGVKECMTLESHATHVSLKKKITSTKLVCCARPYQNGKDKKLMQIGDHEFQEVKQEVEDVDYESLLRLELNVFPFHPSSQDKVFMCANCGIFFMTGNGNPPEECRPESRYSFFD